jgi:hypothetical protein
MKLTKGGDILVALLLGAFAGRTNRFAKMKCGQARRWLERGAAMERAKRACARHSGGAKSGRGG